MIDSHAHLTSSSIFSEIDPILKRAQESGVKGIINICTDPESLERGIELKKRYPWIYNVGSTTPHDVDKEGKEAFPFFEKHALAGNLCAIGETGLDYHYKHSPVEVQKKFLKRYLKLAQEAQLPVVIHCREAFSDLFEILDEDFKEGCGVLHCFTGNIEEADEVIKRKWYLSLSGIVTFKKSEMLREVAKRVPLNQLLIETDSPYLAPQSKRGHPNEPAYLSETVQCLSSIKGIPFEELVHMTSQNAQAIFKFKLS